MLFIFTYIGGNHEIGAAEAWLPFQTRFPSPYKGSGSSHFCYYGKEVGPVHVIALCTYAGFFHISAQYQWLQTYLATKINRVRTPWLIVMTHVSLYNSNQDHWMEGELMRLSMEPLLYQYGVDAYLTGHVHTYERSKPVYDNKIDPCGAVHLVVGDGGNSVSADSRELTVPWRLPQPAWSAFRVASFGAGQLDVLSSQTMKFTWRRVACSAKPDAPAYGMNFSKHCISPYDNSAQKALAYDSYTFTKPTKAQCPNRWKSSTTLRRLETDVLSEPLSTTAATDAPFNQSFDVKDGLLIGMVFLCSLFAFLFFKERKNKYIVVNMTDVTSAEKV